MTLEEARAFLEDDDAPFVRWCEAAGILSSSKDCTFEDLLLCLTRRGLPAELGACTLYVRTKRPRENDSIGSFIMDTDNWKNYLKKEGFIS